MWFCNQSITKPNQLQFMRPKANLLRKQHLRWWVFALLLVSSLSVRANRPQANIQEATISIKMINKPIVELLNTVEEQTTFYTSYTNKTVEGITITGNYANIKLLDLLKVVSGETGLEFKVRGNNILIFKGVRDKELFEVAIPEPEQIGSYLKHTNYPVQIKLESLFGNDPISGTVHGEDGFPLIGATIRIKGSTKGLIVDNDGAFNIKTPGSDFPVTLVVSYIGYKTKEVVVEAPENLEIVLELDAQQLEDAIVVGYGSIEKSDIVGSVASVDINKATATPTTNVSEMIRGRAPGVRVSLNDARPGGTSNILIRGKVSLVGNAPLIIVDGVPYDNINNVSPDDIKSIEVLKDASSQAIYGARAANGVILITTKRGDEGALKVNYHGYISKQKFAHNFDLFTADEFIQLRREAQRTGNNDEYLADETIFEEFELEAIQNRNFVDWEDLVMEEPFMTSHTLSLSGGGENTKVYTGFNYFSQDGVIPTSGFERASLRLNVDQKISERVSLSANVNYQSGRQDVESQGLNFITLSPLAKPYDENGNVVKNPLGPSSILVSPLWMIQESTHDVNTDVIDINLVGNWQINDKLSYTLNTYRRNRNSFTGIYQTSEHPNADADNGRGFLRNSQFTDFLVENIIDYKTTLSHNQTLDVTLLQSINERDYAMSSFEKRDFQNDELKYNGSAATLLNEQRDVWSRKLVSFMGRVRYNLMDKYLLTVTARRDGSSVFAENNKWAFFPAVAVAWKMHEEPFLAQSDLISQAKLRVSYGATGNEGIAPGGTLGTTTYYPYTFGGTTSSGSLTNGQLPNPDLKWETTYTQNYGLDWELWNGKVSGSIEYYNSTTKDLLLNRTVPGTTGFEFTRYNIGEVNNQGFEGQLNANVLTTPDFNWSVGAVFSRNKNKIVDLIGKDENGEPIDFRSEGLFVGQPIDVINQKIFDGIWQEGDNIAESAQPDAMPGDIRVVDIDGDGDIDGDDNLPVAIEPKWTGSLNTTVSWKGFTLFADIYIVEGATRSNNFLNGNTAGGLQGNKNGIAVDYYLPESPSNDYPRPRPGTPANLFALAVQDASYVRLRSVVLSYDLPPQVLNNIGFNNAQIYFSGTNLVTWTDYLSWSPEINPGDFPDARSYTIGIKLGL